MANGFMSAGGGLSKGKLAAATADEAKVLAPYTFYAKDKTLKTGSMKNISANPTTHYRPNNFTPVIEGDEAFCTTNADNVERLCIRYAENDKNGGYITGNTLFGIEKDDACTAIGKYKGDTSATITPSTNAQSYTFATNGKYCTGNMVVSVPATKVYGGWGMRLFCLSSDRNLTDETINVCLDGAGTYAWCVSSTNWWGNDNSPMYFTFFNTTYGKKYGNNQHYSYSGINYFNPTTTFTAAMYGGSFEFYCVRLY